MSEPTTQCSEVHPFVEAAVGSCHTISTATLIDAAMMLQFQAYGCPAKWLNGVGRALTLLHRQKHGTIGPQLSAGLMVTREYRSKEPEMVAALAWDVLRGTPEHRQAAAYFSVASKKSLKFLAGDRVFRLGESDGIHSLSVTSLSSGPQVGAYAGEWYDLLKSIERALRVSYGQSVLWPEIRQNELLRDFSPTLQETIKLVLKGFTEPEIAAHLQRNRHTTHDQIRNVYVAFQVHSRAEFLIRWHDLMTSAEPFSLNTDSPADSAKLRA